MLIPLSYTIKAKFNLPNLSSHKMRPPSGLFPKFSIFVRKKSGLGCADFKNLSGKPSGLPSPPIIRGPVTSDGRDGSSALRPWSNPAVLTRVGEVGDMYMLHGGRWWAVSRLAVRPMPFKFFHAYG
jgi:hypothetical protein